MKYEAKIFYSGYLTIPVEADSSDDAVEKARIKANGDLDFLVQFKTDGLNDFLDTLEPWREADEVEEIIS